MAGFERTYDAPNEGVLAAQNGQLIAVRSTGFRWEQRFPDGSMIIIREETHGLGHCPCEHQPPDEDVWHYNIEYQAPLNGGTKNRSVFNLHSAVWASAGRACFAIYNAYHVSASNRVSRCIYSDCVDEGDRQRVEDAIHEVALEIQSALQAAAGIVGQVLSFAWDVMVAIATFIVWAILSPVFGSQPA